MGSFLLFGGHHRESHFFSHFFEMGGPLSTKKLYGHVAKEMAHHGGVVDSDDDLLRHVYDNLKGQGTVEQIMAHEDVQRANPVRQMFPFPYYF